MRRSASTVKELAATLEVAPKSLYYHVNLLERHGLIRVVDTRLVSGIVERRYRATAYLFTFDTIGLGDEGEPREQAITGLSSVFEMTRDDIWIGLESGMIQPVEDAPPRTRLSMEWNLIHLSPERRDELDRKLCALFREFATPPPGSEDEQPYRYLYLVFPTFVRGERPDLPAPGSVEGEAS